MEQKHSIPRKEEAKHERIISKFRPTILITELTVILENNENVHWKKTQIQSGLNILALFL